MTAAGVLCRIIGFFYRIFLSRAIGAEALGIYQMTVPIFSICFALTASSAQTTISRFVGDAIGQSKNKKTGENNARFYLLTGIIISLIIAVPLGFLLYFRAEFIAENILGEARLIPLIKMLSFSLIPGCLHADINGYYYGKKRAGVPSACQVFEQISRVGSVYILYLVCMEKGIEFSAYQAVAGLVISEFAGLLFCAIVFLSESGHPLLSYGNISGNLKNMTHSFCAMLFPLTLNRVIVALSGSLENLLIPQKLMLFGYSNADALSVYGVLTGMTLSVIMLPAVISNSFSVLLLPEISEAKVRNDNKKISAAIKRAVFFGLLLGLFFTVLFLLSGDLIGSRIFHNSLSGVFIKRLAFLCPLMYITSLLSSILHGLGRASQVLYINLLSCLIRISMIWFLVPLYGIGAYLWGLILSGVFGALSELIVLGSRSPQSA
jgi:stage V sporulation protein B